jgi:superfamily II DNA or RNA helicase
MAIRISNAGSFAEDRFIEIFCDAFGLEKAEYLVAQYPFVDIYGNHRYLDFAFENEDNRIAIEIDGESYHNPKAVSPAKYQDDLLKQNSIIYYNWRLYRWAYGQIKNQPEKVKDQLITFLGDSPVFKALDDYLPKQRGHKFTFNLEFKQHQSEALKNLTAMRENKETIALLHQATGTGKTVTAVMDAKSVGKPTLFLAHTKELVEQAYNKFSQLWDVESGIYMGDLKQKSAFVVCASIQSVSQNIHEFDPVSFDYLIIDECHHSAASSYRKILRHFKPSFTLGLTATPERMDGEDLLEIFQNVAHKLDLKTAVEIGELVPVRCIRVKTNIDFTQVRINGVRYRSQDLEETLFVPERNKILVNTYIEYAKNKKTVIFCVSVKHAKEIAALLQKNGINAHAISGNMKEKDRKNVLWDYENGEIQALCACDLLNEGWDSPKTEVLFMARPTMSKTLYIQQLGRGMRKAEGKECLIVFDFIDNANMFNAPYTIHKLINIKEYRPGGFIIAPGNSEDSVMRGERPEILLDTPLNVFDYELLDLFNWQDEIKDMVSEKEFVRMVDIQSGAIDARIKEGRIVPDLVVPIGVNRKFNYFYKKTVLKYADEFGWDIITSENIKQKFFSKISKMDMAYSYKPVLLKAMLSHTNEKGKVKVQHMVKYMINFYDQRRTDGLPVEKKNSIYCKPEFTEKEVEKNIFANPFNQFEEMGFVKRTKDLDVVEFNNKIYKSLTDKDKDWIIEVCDSKIEEYYAKRVNN